jgi:2-haloalkanoic acid dehalogenase type II
MVSVDVTAASTYQAIIFDVGGTLLEILRDPQELAIESIAHLGTVSPVTYTAAIRQVVQEWRDAGGRPELEDLPETWIAHNRRALTRSGFTGDISAAAEIIENTFLNDGWTVFSDVTDTLSSLRDQRYKLGIISNWPSTLEKTLERSGLRSYFSVVVGSGNVGYAKPHPQIFRIAADQMGVRPGEALYVGDSVEYDVAGARAAGMNVVLLDREGRCLTQSPRIQSLSQLTQLLQYNTGSSMET